MRIHTLGLVLLGGLFGCRTAPVPSSPRSAIIDASFSREPESTSMQVMAHDPVVAQLLRASLAAYEHQRRVMLENLTNVNTCGYKRRVVCMTTQDVAGSDGQAFQVPVVQGTVAIFTVGTLEATDRNLDLAIDGDGFFAVMRVGGSTGYTRNGSLQIDVRGKIVTGQGLIVLPEITVPNDTLEISIDPEGLVTGRTAGSPDTTTSFGQLTIHRFTNQAGLRIENGIYQPTDASGCPVTATPGTSGLGLLKQGFLERSNVQTTNELVNLQILEQQHDALVRVMRHFGLVAP